MLSEMLDFVRAWLFGDSTGFTALMRVRPVSESYDQILSYLLAQALLGASVLQERLANFYDQREAVVDIGVEGYFQGI